MKRTRSGLPLLLVLLCGAAWPAQELAEWWDFYRDPDGWTLVRPSSEARQGERVYALKGENAYFWNELVTTGYANPGGLPDNYIIGFVNELSENCRPLKVQGVEQTPTSVIFEWEGDCRIVGPQVEIRRVAIGPKGVHYLAYAAKPNRLTPEKRDYWLNLIRAAKLRQQ